MSGGKRRRWKGARAVALLLAFVLAACTTPVEDQEGARSVEESREEVLESSWGQPEEMDLEEEENPAEWDSAFPASFPALHALYPQWKPQDIKEWPEDAPACDNYVLLPISWNTTNRIHVYDKDKGVAAYLFYYEQDRQPYNPSLRNVIQMDKLGEDYIVYAKDFIYVFDREFNLAPWQFSMENGWGGLEAYIWSGEDILVRYKTQDGYLVMDYKEAGNDEPVRIEPDVPIEYARVSGWHREGESIFFVHRDIDRQDIVNIHMATGQVEYRETLWVQFTDPWAITADDPAGDNVMITAEDGGGGGVVFTVWEEGRPLVSRATDQLEHVDPAQPPIKWSDKVHYYPEENRIGVEQTTRSLSIPMDQDQPVSVSLAFPEGYLRETSPDGVYQVYYLEHPHQTMQYVPQSTYIRNTVTGQQYYAYHWVRDRRRSEPLAIGDTWLFRCFANEFYDLATGEKLPFRLQTPSPEEDHERFGHNFLDLKIVPELDAIAAIRTWDQSGNDHRFALELYNRDGSFRTSWKTDFYADTGMVGPFSLEQPRAMELDVWGTRVIFGDYAGETDETRYNDTGWISRTVVVDLADFTYHKLRGGPHWARHGDVVVTAEALLAGEERVRLDLYKYDNMELVESATHYIEGDVTVLYDTVSKDGMFTYDPETDTLAFTIGWESERERILWMNRWNAEEELVVPFGGPDNT